VLFLGTINEFEKHDIHTFSIPYLCFWSLFNNCNFLSRGKNARPWPTGNVLDIKTVKQSSIDVPTVIQLFFRNCQACNSAELCLQPYIIIYI
jgi:hypothetical protein